MIAGGVLDNHPADFVIGGSLTSFLPVGFVATRPGVLMSQANALVVNIEGKGGHGAMSSEDGNVVLAVSALAPRLGEVVAGLEFEGGTCACSAESFTRAPRTMWCARRGRSCAAHCARSRPTNSSVSLERLGNILDEIGDNFNVTCSLTLEDGTPAVINDTNVARRVIESAGKVVGNANVLDLPPVSPSDDMSEFLNRIPGSYMFIGGALADGTTVSTTVPTSPWTTKHVEPLPACSRPARWISLSRRRAWATPCSDALLP